MHDAFSDKKKKKIILYDLTVVQSLRPRSDDISALSWQKNNQTLQLKYSFIPQTNTVLIIYLSPPLTTFSVGFKLAFFNIASAEN